MKRICLFTGSRLGSNPLYTQVAKDFGDELVSRDLELVYGGGNVGLMKVAADEVMARGGRVTGVIPHFLMDRELAHPGISDLIVVDSMQERKSKMRDLSCAFVALPGGFGTLDEIFEMVTEAQLKVHSKPIGLVNTDGYYDHLIQFVDHCVEQQFAALEHRKIFIVAQTPKEILDMIISS